MFTSFCIFLFVFLLFGVVNLIFYIKCVNLGIYDLDHYQLIIPIYDPDVRIDLVVLLKVLYLIMVAGIFIIWYIHNTEIIYAMFAYDILLFIMIAVKYKKFRDALKKKYMV